MYYSFYMRKFLSICLLIGSFVLVIISGIKPIENTSAAGMYCSILCSGADKVLSFYSGIGCVRYLSAPNCEVCNAGTSQRVECSNVPTNISQGGKYCKEQCADTDTEAYYPVGHTCRLAGQTGIWKCDATGKFVKTADDPAPTKNTKTPVPTQTEAPVALEINKVILPSNFTKPDSLTTKLLNITATNVTSYPGLTFDDPGNSSVTFLEEIDLSDLTLVGKLNELDQYLVLSKTYVDLNSEVLVQFKDKAARIRMYSVNVNPDNIEILKDGEIATNITNINYDQNSKTLTFDVDGFSKYEVLEETEDVISPQPIANESNSLNTLIIIAVIIFCIICLVSLVILILLIKKRRKKVSQISSEQPTVV